MRVRPDFDIDKWCIYKDKTFVELLRDITINNIKIDDKLKKRLNELRNKNSNIQEPIQFRKKK